MKENNPDVLKPLLDVQNLPDERGVDLVRVGVRGVEVPIHVMQEDGRVQKVAAMATMGVGLTKQKKGVHMSRFISQLTEWSRDKAITLDLRAFLGEAMARLDAPSAFIDLGFRYFIEKPAPVSGISAPMAYGCNITGVLKRTVDTETYRVILGITIPVSTLCPCSKAISDYGAHNQRAEIHVRVNIDTETDHAIVWIEDLAKALEECASCPVYPFLKREDEKYVTERQYDNPKFVEDVIRDAAVLLRSYSGITGFALEVEALESIHGHNAWTDHSENFVEI